MRTIDSLIHELIQYGIQNALILPDDVIYTTNRLLEFFKLTEYTNPDKEDAPRTIHEILDDMLTYASESGLLETDTITCRDLFDTAIMGLITPPPSLVRQEFAAHYAHSPQEATDFYYRFSRATNYIRADRIAKDEKWVTPTEFGDLDITINLSKPEKDPRDIAAAGKAKKSGYPACLLCQENEGYAGHISHPARQNHRIIPLTLDGEPYYLQYSPYVYYNEHCIIFNEKHIPMKINRATMKKLLCFVDQFPHYTAGSNADLPIVGGSILSHDHFQGGGYEFPMVRAPYETEFELKGYEDIRSGIIKWPLSTIRLQGHDMERIVALADHILNKWRNYTDEAAFILAETDGVPHNTITPIARMRHLPDSKDVYELDLVLRNNITTTEHPLGVYHPQAQYHHIKKENIGLIEVMGLAVLPARLKTEMTLLEEFILTGKNLYSDDRIRSHAEWAADFLPKYGYEVAVSTGHTCNSPSSTDADLVSTTSSACAVVTKLPDGNLPAPTANTDTAKQLHEIIQREIGLVFSGVLEDAGVYKCTDDGKAAFQRFVQFLNN
ncbi:MAG: UDP-glucose--hexose-1-phosphate uridylyltransferase [Lachnospiraceae bacterium]|nr:UDP-glucose--hexose-1-phosphate uridylyltransferase [Lachnospiraceae bacterium]